LQEGEPSTALYDQQLITMAPSPKFEFEHGSNVQEVLKKWSQVRGVEGEGLQVVELARWELGAAEEAKE
jgi:elongation factor Ts